MPKPALARSLNLYETAGLMLSVLTLDSMPWKRPIQSSSYLVLSPKGTLMASPKFQVGFRSMAKNRLGMSAVSPASPPFPVRPGLLAAPGVLPLLVNFVDGAIRCRAPRACLPRGRRAIPAGFHHTVDASSATAAAPA